MEFDAGRRELIEAVLEPLPEQEEARQALQVAVAGSVGLLGSTRELEIPAAAARMKKSAPRFMAVRKWSAIAMATTMIIVLWFSFLSPGAWQSLYRMTLATQAEADWSYMTEAESPPRLPLQLLHHRNAEDHYQSTAAAVVADQQKRMPDTRFLVNSYPHDRTEPLRHWRMVWDASSQDPALFFVYSMAYLKEKNVLPPDFVDTGERLDPGNGWFRLCSAAVSTGEVLERDNWRRKSPFLVKDPVKLQAVLAELELASQMPRWDDYRSRLFQMASAEWPVPDDLPDQVFSHGTFQNIPMAMEDYPLLQLRAALEIWLQDADSAKDPSVLDAVTVRFEAICRHWSDCESGYTGREWQRMATWKGAEVLAGAYWARRNAAGQAKYNGIAAAMFDAAPQGYQWTCQDQAGILTRGNSAAFERPAWITPDEVRPGRLAEYVMWERLFFQCLTAALALLLLTCLFLPRTERKQLEFLPERLTGFLCLRDRLLAGSIGVGVPVAVYLLTRNSGLDPRDQFLSESRCAMLLCQIAGLVISALLLVWSALALSLRRNAAAVGFRRGRFAIPLGLAVTALITIPLAGWLPQEFERQKLEVSYAHQCIGFMTALPLLWLLTNAAGWRFSPFERRLPRVTLIRACSPLFGIMALGSLVAVEALHHEERGLVRQMDFESVHSLQRGRISPAHLEKAEEIRTALRQQFKQ